MVTDSDMVAAVPPVGRDKPVCGAEKRQGEGTCRRPAGWGTDHPGTGRCKLHGGGTPSHRARARTEQAKAALVRLGRPVEIDPLDALARALWESWGHAAWLRAELEAQGTLAPDTLGSGAELASLIATDGSARALYELWAAERDRAVKVSSECVRLGIRQREVALAESVGEALAEVIRGVLADLVLTDTQRASAPGIVRQHLAAMAARSGAIEARSTPSAPLGASAGDAGAAPTSDALDASAEGGSGT